MLSPFLRIVHLTRIQSHVWGLRCRSALLGLLGGILLLSPSGTRADVYNITFINVTFTATCIGGQATCTEVINGSGLYDPVTDTGWNISIQMTRDSECFLWRLRSSSSMHCAGMSFRERLYR